MTEVRCGELWWANLPAPFGSEPGYRRPVLIIQAESFNRGRIRTVLVAVVTGNLALAEAPGNVLLPAEFSRLPKDSVLNVSQILTLDRTRLQERVSKLSGSLMTTVDNGLRLVMSL